jgi:hypothetical protein
MTMPNLVNSPAGSETLVPWGTHAAGDVGILAIETATENTGSITGWDLVGFVQGGSATRISVYKREAASGAEADVDISGITANHRWGVIFVFRDADPDLHRVIGTHHGATVNGHFPSFRTELDNCLVVNLMAYALDNAGPIASSEANGSLANVTEVYDAGTDAGNGGGIVAITGEKAAAGAVDGTTTTLTSTGWASLTLAIKPKRAVAYVGTVTLASGGAAPDGTAVTIYDDTQPDAPVVTAVAGGSGGYSALVRYDDHEYRPVAEDGSGNTGAGTSAVP